MNGTVHSAQRGSAQRAGDPPPTCLGAAWLGGWIEGLRVSEILGQVWAVFSGLQLCVAI